MTVKRADQVVGLRNAARGARLPFGSMKTADNVDHADTMTLECRQGSRKIASLSGVTSGYTSRDGRFVFTVEAGTIKRREVLFDFDGTSSAMIETFALGIGPQALTWDDDGHRAVCMGGDEGFFLSLADVAQQAPFRLPTPDQPKLMPLPGTLPVGAYQFTCNYRHKASGLWSGTPTCATIRLDAPAAIFVDPPTRADCDTLVWATPTDGTSDSLYLLGEGPCLLGGAQLAGLKHPLPAEFFQRDPAPDGVSCCAFHGGRLFVAHGEWLTASEQMGYHLFNVQQNTFGFVGQIVGLQSTAEGLLVLTDRQVCLWRAPGDQAVLLEFGALPWRPAWRDIDGTVAFATVRGFYAFPPLKPLTDGKFAPSMGATAFVAIRRQRGCLHALTLTDEPRASDNPYR